ncbi:MAG: 3-deoxy-7-phosphoheptulonate synthase, partial [Fibrobacter sp.]|nr:3-deoxy-7-phosphoheptulonate synthase [Fibrobacter sp.]
MGFKKICKLPLPDEIKEKIPVSNELKNIKNKRDREILD